MTLIPSIRSRQSQLEALGNHIFDVLIIGGGIVGVATAHVLLSRGYRVGLIDNRDFASGTSQESSQLIWGGIKYLERGHVGLVNDLCLARNQLVAQYPERVIPQRFLYPFFSHEKHFRASVAAGSYAYWVIGGAFGAPPLVRTTGGVNRLVPLLKTDGIRGGLEYTDARMVKSDARFVLDLLFDAVDMGLTAANYIELEDVGRRGHRRDYELTATDLANNERLTIQTKWIVNTAGCWVDEVNAMLGVKAPHELIFSKGIHLIVPRIETSGRALTCRGKDGRVFFVIPWGTRTLVGTTDTPFDEPPRRVQADADDIAYLRKELEEKFRMTIGDEDILNTKAGLRPLVKPRTMRGQNFLELARGHEVWSDSSARISALWGGKFTDAFLMARELANTVEIRPTIEGGEIPPALPAVYPTESDFMNGEVVWDRVTDACHLEMVVTIEDMLRRRTNIALKVARSGWGHQEEHEPQMHQLAEAVARAAGRKADRVFEEYRRRTIAPLPVAERPPHEEERRVLAGHPAAPGASSEQDEKS